MNIGDDSTLSASIVPINAFGYSSHADVSSGGVSFERPVQDSEPNTRLGAFKSRSSSAARDNRKASANPGARPAATKGHPQSTGGISKRQYTVQLRALLSALKMGPPLATSLECQMHNLPRSRKVSLLRILLPTPSRIINILRQTGLRRLLVALRTIKFLLQLETCNPGLTVGRYPTPSMLLKNSRSPTLAKGPKLVSQNQHIAAAA